MTSFNSKEYWESRYRTGGNSGAGSYNHLAKYKAVFLTDFIEGHNIKSMVEFGCGDGNNLKITSDYNPELVVEGVDVSQTALSMCREKMPQHIFTHKDEFDYETKDLVVSLDVIYHLIEDEVYEDYMESLVKVKAEYIIIYSPDFENNNYAEHVRARKFSENKFLIKKYDLIKKHDNDYSTREYNDGSFSDWYIFKKK